ncbi:MAG: DUF3597 domain-containing protein [Alphaproteobacteria bacterium]|nr:MAG: DUF3597 domain-containing protein [Alphaproteobacteria bacterium]
MGILSNIFRKIFPSSHAANAPAAPSPTSTATPGAATPGAAVPGSAAAPASAAPVAMNEVDVEKLLDEKAKNAGEKLNWKTSIVDLMKLLDLDSSLSSRKELAKELNYTGDTNDSASMNVWLHRQVMTKVAANGGKLPADLKD